MADARGEGARRGSWDGSPWADQGFDLDGTPPLDQALRRRLADNLHAHRVATLRADGLRRAAVSVVVVDGDPAEPDARGLTHVVCAFRGRAGSHVHQFALPGGRIDAGETALQAALRELEEEVGITAAEAQVLGRLDDYVTRSGYHITPFVLWAPDAAPYVASPAELLAVDRIPLGELLRDDSPTWAEIPESDRPVLRLPVGEHHIHAPTAAVLYQMVEVGYHGRDTRVADVEEPVFAWR